MKIQVNYWERKQKQKFGDNTKEIQTKSNTEIEEKDKYNNWKDWNCGTIQNKYKQIQTQNLRNTNSKKTNPKTIIWKYR